MKPMKSFPMAGSRPVISRRSLSEGYVQIVGRKRERILRGGYSVFPQEVEAVLLSHPAVAEAAVVGIADADLGEEVAAFVSLKRWKSLPAKNCWVTAKIISLDTNIRGDPDPVRAPQRSDGKILKSALVENE